MYGPVSHKVSRTVCYSDKCKLYWSGQEQCIFRVTHATAAGYEIGWHFVDLVIRSKCSFKSFCDLMTATYLRANQSSRGFMDQKTFIQWWFSWASHQDIEFRQVCQWCGPDPEVLAADGTKIGISTHMSCVEPINKSHGEIPANHRRLTRCFIPSQFHKGKCVADKNKTDARLHLLYLAKSTLGKLPSLDDNLLQSRHQNLKEQFPVECLPLLEAFISQEMSLQLLKATANVFLLFGSEASLTTILPIKTHYNLKMLLADSANIQQKDFKQAVINISLHAPEIAFFLSAASTTDNGISTLNDFVRESIKYLISFIEKTHDNDTMPSEAIPIVNSYNPPQTGRAYYFHHDGRQIRVPRSLPDEKVTKTNSYEYDDIPETDLCSKHYPLVGKGSTYLFCWFCPNHGHCYGFHIIDGSEGRKDAAHSIYSYKKTAPAVVLYDFACSMEEYCLNRETGYWKNTAFFHDIFHGYKHKCSIAFKCTRLQHMDVLNTSICEQFNSYLQCIKATARHMSQTHFMFFTQYFVHRWNEEKRLRFEHVLKTAAATTEW